MEPDKTQLIRGGHATGVRHVFAIEGFANSSQ